MALQTKTISYGSFAYKSYSNGYMLDLILAEESVDNSANTSQISFKLQLRSGSSNRFTANIDCTVTIAGKSFSRADKQITAAYNYTYTLLTGSLTVPHAEDGTLEMVASASIDTPESNPYAPPDLSFEGTMTLTEIPRVSMPTVSPSPVAAGGVLSIRTNRKTDAFTHSLSYVFGDATGTIGENVGDLYDWTVPEDLAAQIPEASTGWGTLTCSTFNGEVEVGSVSVAFAITVPQNETTRPQMDPVLAPMNDGVPEIFADLYIQGKSKVQAQLNAVAWHSVIANQTIQVQGLTNSGADPLISGVLLQSGTSTVVCNVTDGRGYSNSRNIDINVLPYRRPSAAPYTGLSNVICCRCDAAGNPNINGTKVLLKASRNWSNLAGRNGCQLRYRIREEEGAWPSEWRVLLMETDAENQVDMVLEDLLNTKLSYQVQLSALDTLGEEGVLTLPIGTASTPLHLGRGGKNVGLGRYCNYEHENAVDVGWDMFLDGHANGMYWDVATLSGTTFTVQSCFAAFDDMATAWQTLLLWGSCGGQLVHGTIAVSNAGTTAWAGTDGVSVAAGSDGKIIITVPQAAGDQLVLMSTNKFDMN